MQTRVDPQPDPKTGQVSYAVQVKVHDDCDWMYLTEGDEILLRDTEQEAQAVCDGVTARFHDNVAKALSL